MATAWIARVLITVFCGVSIGIASASSVVEGTVRGPDGKAFKGADVRLENLSAKAAAALVKTNDAGKYRFTNVAPGVYKVTVLSGNAIRAFIEGVRVNGTKRVDFEIKPAAAGQVKKAKHLVYVPPDTGTNIGGRWVEVEDDASTTPDGSRVEKRGSQWVRRVQSDAPQRAQGGP